MGLFGSIAMAIGIPLVAVIIGLVLWRTKGRGWPIILAVAAGVVLLMLAGPALLGHPGEARVAGKSAKLVRTRQDLIATITYRRMATLEYQGRRFQSEVDQKEYPRLAVGQNVAVHIAAVGPVTTVTLAGGDFPAIVAERSAGILNLLSRIAAVAAVSGLIAAPALRSRPLALLAGSVGLAAVGLAMPGLIREMAARPRRASAEVVSIAEVGSVSFSSLFTDNEERTLKLDPPYREITVRYAPQGAAEPIQILDRVDLSGPPAAPGQALDLAYSPDRPFDAHLVGFSRSALWRNTLRRWSGLVIPWFALGLAGALLVWAYGRRKAMTTR